MRLIYSLCVFSVLVAQTPLTKEQCNDFVLQYQADNNPHHKRFYIGDIKMPIGKKDSLDLAPHLDNREPKIRQIMNCVDEHFHTWEFDLSGEHVSSEHTYDEMWIKFDFSDLDANDHSIYTTTSYSISCQYFIFDLRVERVHPWRSDSYLKGLDGALTNGDLAQYEYVVRKNGVTYTFDSYPIGDGYEFVEANLLNPARNEAILTQEQLDHLYVSKTTYNELQATTTHLLAKIIKPVVPVGFVVHGYNRVTEVLSVGYRGPFEWCIYHEDFTPFAVLGTGKSRGGDNVDISLSSLASGQYWVVFIYAGSTFRVQIIKQ